MVVVVVMMVVVMVMVMVMVIMVVVMMMVILGHYHRLLFTRYRSRPLVLGAQNLLRIGDGIQQLSK